MPPLYDYFCDQCDKPYEVVKSMKEYDGKDKCPVCLEQGRRIYSANIHFIGTKVKDSYKCPALGQVIKSDAHRKELTKQLGVIEVGNEKPETVHKYFDEQRATKSKKSYEDL